MYVIIGIQVMTHAHCVFWMLPVGCYDSTHQRVSVSETGVCSRQHPSTCSASYAFFPLHAAWRLMMAYGSPAHNLASARPGSFSIYLQDCQCCSPISTKPQCPSLQAMLYSGMNGIGLALVVPCVQSLIADYPPADKRGAAFGVL